MGMVSRVQKALSHSRYVSNSPEGDSQSCSSDKGKAKKKLFLVASAGGHLSELQKLNIFMAGYEHVFITTSEVVRTKLEQLGRVFVLGECNREHPLKTFVVMVKCVPILLKERPDVVLSTGAAPGLLVCFWGKLFGAQIIWIDSIANTQKLSMSGCIARLFADLVLSQWPNVAAAYRNVEYTGEVI